MTPKETTVVAIKILVIYMLVSIVIDAPSTAMYVVLLGFNVLVETSTQQEIYLLVFWMVVISIVLIWIITYILSWLLRTILSQDTKSILIKTTPMRFELVILNVLGLYFVIDGLSTAIYDIWYYQKESSSSFFCGLGVEGFMTIFSYTIEVVVGLILMLFPKKVALFLIDIRRDY